MKTEIGDADRLAIYRLISKMAPDRSEKRVWTQGDVCVSAVAIGNRTGVPKDASTWVYELHYPYAPAWTAAVRAVWRCGELHRPLTTHVQVIDLDDLDLQLGGPGGVLPVFSDWLASLPL